MLERYEELVAVTYLLNAARSARRLPLLAKSIDETLAQVGEQLAIELNRFEDADHSEDWQPRRRRRRLPRANGVHPDRWAEIEEALAARHAALGKVAPGPTERCIREIGRIAALSQVECQVLGLALRPQTSDLFATMAQELGGSSYIFSSTRSPLVAACMLGLSPGRMEALLAPDGRLLACGLLCIDHDGDIVPLRGLVRAVRAARGRSFDLQGYILGTPQAASLDWSDFDHIATDRDHVLRVLAGAIERRERGIHVLLYGPPGTGKTEFCKTLAARLNIELFSVGEADDDGGEPSRGERVAAYRLAQMLLRQGKCALVLFDEAEDLFDGAGDAAHFFLGRGRPPGSGSKVFINRLIEGTAVPTIWTINDLAAMRKSAIRRMTYAIAFDVPPPGVRARIWRREFQRARMQAPESEIHRIAGEFETAPSLASRAVLAASLAQGGVSEARRTVEALTRAMRGGVPEARKVASDLRFDPRLINADMDLERLAGRLTGPESSRAVSFCLAGPPGTGKSAWVRHLAWRLGMQVLHKRVSDLVSMWVGESEKNIARAFAEARRAGGFLVFDEADSLLGDRTGALRSWEVSQVNEMLTWMECHDLPFACTTNLASRLDPASLRRFTFKVKFDYLTAEQAALAFALFFDLPAPAGLADLNTLTPGDFAVAAREAAVLGSGKDPDALLDLLRRECAAKPGHRRPIGFQARP